MNKLRKYKFSDLYDMASGISSTKEQAGHGTPFLSFRTAFNNYFLPDVLPDFMDTSEIEQEIYSIKAGDIFLTRTSETADALAMSCVAVKDYPKATYSGFLKRLRPKTYGVVYAKYMAFFLRSKYFRKVIDCNTIMTLRASFNEDIFSFLNLYLPSYEVQVRIGDFLYNTEKKIQNNKKINDNLDHQAFLIVERYLNYTNSSVSLKEIMKFENGYAFRSETYLNEGLYKIITIKNVQDRRIDSRGASCINEIPSSMPNNCRLCIGDVLISLTGNIGRVGIVCENNLLLNQRVAKIAPVDKELLPFLYFMFLQPRVKKYMKLFANGTAQKNLSPVEMLKLQIPYEINSAYKISEILKPMFDMISVKKQENINLRKFRDWLLPMLMNGQATVED